MKIPLILLIFGFFSLQAQEILHIPSYDNEIIEGRLYIPSDYKNIIVIDIPSSGPHTYENMRLLGRSTKFKYHDYFKDEFAKRGIAYFSYSTRYTKPDSTNPPYYDKVDREKFYTYTPIIKVQDLEEVVKFLKKDNRLASSKFILLGFSEGAILATMAAERRNVSVARVGGKKFEDWDMNKDTLLTSEDFRITLEAPSQQIFDAIEKNDDELKILFEEIEKL